MIRTATLALAILSLAHTEASAGPAPGEGDDELRFSGGVFLGANVFSRQIELGNAFPDDQTPRSAPLVGARIGYLLIPNMLIGSEVRPRLHVELETKFAASSTRGDSDAGRGSYFSPVIGWRAQARVDLWPQWEVTPFAVAGIGGETFVSRSPWVYSPDTDGAFLWGVGAEYDINPQAGLRVDLRQGITAARSRRLTATYEAHAGFFVRFGETQPPVERRIFAEGPPPGDEPDAARHDDSFAQVDLCPEGGDDDCERGVVANGDDVLASREPGADGPADTGADEPADTGADEPADTDAGEPADTGADEPADTGADEPAETDAGEREADDAIAALSATAARVRFEVGSADLQPASRTHLDEIAALLARHADLRVEVGGHTDSRGARSLNVMLSHARAKQVVRYLVDRGVDEDRLEAAGYGPDRPIATNDTAAGRAENRRIEIKALRAGD